MLKKILGYILFGCSILVGICITPFKIGYTLACEYEIQIRQYFSSIRK